MSLTYANGKAPDSALGFIDGTHVTPDVYERVALLQVLAALHGLEVHVIRLGGYANLTEQRARQKVNNKASTIPVALVGDSTHGVYAAAYPGAHVPAGRVDLGSTVTSYTNSWLAQLIPLAATVGLVREFGSADPNHFIASAEITWSPPAPQHQLTQEEIDEMAANQTAAQVRDYQRDGQGGQIFTALIDPNGVARKLNGTEDINSAIRGHAKAFGTPLNDASYGDDRPWGRYPRQLTAAEWQWFWLTYEGPMRGFSDADFPAGRRPIDPTTNKPKGA